jgi:hypothetical protein
MVSFRASQRLLGRSRTGKGMVLPFTPLSLAFQHMYYSVDLPAVSLPFPVCSCAKTQRPRSLQLQQSVLKSWLHRLASNVTCLSSTQPHESKPSGCGNPNGKVVELLGRLASQGE